MGMGKLTAAVDLARLEDGELIIGTRNAIEAEALVVFVPVRVRRRTSFTTVLDVAAGSISSGSDGKVAVTDASANGERGPVLEISGGGGDQGHEREQADDGELHVGGWKSVGRGVTRTDRKKGKEESGAEKMCASVATNQTMKQWEARLGSKAGKQGRLKSLFTPGAREVEKYQGYSHEQTPCRSASSRVPLEK